MKVKNYLTILFAVLTIIALLALAGFMTLYIADDSNPLKQQVMQMLHMDISDDVEDTAPETSPESEAASVKEHSILFVGDSRTLGMGEAVNDSCTYLGAEGEGYEWFTSEGSTLLAQALETNPTQKVVFNLGVNDPQNISLYIDSYRSLMSQYPDTPFYMMSVNPLDGSKGEFNTTNEMAEIFNATLESAFPDIYLDCYSYLTQNGFETVDGLHYTEDTYRTIHNYVVDRIA